MSSNKLPHGYWTKERCREEALKFSTLKEFCHSNHKAYDAARRNKWLSEYDWLERVYKLDLEDNSYCIYAYEFTEHKSVYVGLTKDKVRRDYCHRRYSEHADSQSAVYLFCIENNIDPISINKPKYIYDNLTPDKASELEGIVVEDYRTNGWNILNRMETGNLGGGYVKWTKENIIKEFSKFSSLREVKENKQAESAYIMASRHGWAKEILDKVFPDRIKHLKDHTIDSILSLARKHGPRFLKNDSEVFVAKILGCLPEVYKITGYPNQRKHVLIFNKDYTKIIGKFVNSKDAIKKLGINTNNGSYFTYISNTIQKKVSFGYGILRENLFSEFLDSIQDKNLIENLKSDYEKSCNDFDNQIRKDCEKYKNIDLSKLTQKDIKQLRKGP